MSYFVAIIDCPQEDSATASFKEVTVVQEIYDNQTADVIVEDQLLTPLDLATVLQELELHKPNCRMECGRVIHSAYNIARVSLIVSLTKILI